MSYIEENGYLIFDGVKSSDYGVWINGGGTFNAPARRYTDVTVPGRNGSFTIDEGAFEEVEVVYPAFIASGFPANVEAFRNELMARTGYVRMTDSYHPAEYYRAKYMDGLEVEAAPGGVAGAFNLKFKRDPRRFLTTGETAVTDSSITNPTLFPSKPLIRVVGNGVVTIGSDEITIAQNNLAYIDIDSEIEDCYCGTVNANSLVTFQSNDFPELPPGVTGITSSGNITSVTVTPRWYKI